MSIYFNKTIELGYYCELSSFQTYTMVFQMKKRKYNTLQNSWHECMKLTGHLTEIQLVDHIILYGSFMVTGLRQTENM